MNVPKQQRLIAICTKIHFVIVFFFFGNLERTKSDKTFLTAERRLKLGRPRPIAAHNVLADAEAISIVIQYYKEN